MIKLIGLSVLGVVLGVLVLGLLFEQFSEWQAARRFPPPGRMVDAGSHKLHIFCQGEGDGPTILIEQGAGSPSIFWWPVQREIAKTARVCTYDRAGYLWSPSAGKGRSITARVDDLRQMLVNSGERGSFVLVPHSYGGLLVGQLAQRYPELVAGIVFVDTPDETTLYGGNYLEESKQFLGVIGAMRYAAHFGALRFFNPMFSDLPPGFPKADAAALKALASHPGFSAAMLDDFRSMREASAAEKQLAPPGSLGGRPVIVVSHGIPFPPGFDALEVGWDEGQDRLVALSSNSERIIAKESNHVIYFDEPEVVIAAIARVHAAARDSTRLAPSL